MHPESQLVIVAAFTGFLLKTFLGFCLCWAISKVVVSPRRKFLVWFAFLAISCGYWIWLIVTFVPHAASELPLPVQASAPSRAVVHWQLPPSWANPLRAAEKVLGGLYLLVLGNFLVVRIRKQLRLRWVLRFAYEAPEQIQSMFRSLASHFGGEKIRLLVLSGIYSPATFGWLHPVVLLPPLCLEQDQIELGDIFRHELQHVARRDFFFNNVAGFCKAVLFFHPAVWYAMRRMELESELACDLAVVGNSPERRATYAECLVRFARLHAAQDPTPWNLDFAGSSIQLKVRVRSVLKDSVKLPPWLLGLRTTIGMLLLVIFACLAPSLGIVLSYTHRVAQPIVPLLTSTKAKIRARKRSVVRSRERETLLGSSATPNIAVTDSPKVTVASIAANPSKPRQPDTLSSGDPVPTLQQRGAVAVGANAKSARATVFFISNPSSVSAGNSGSAKGRSIASAFMTGASEAARFAGSHGKEIH